MYHIPEMAQYIINQITTFNFEKQRIINVTQNNQKF